MISTAPLNPHFTFKTQLLTPRRFDPPTFRSRSLQFSQLSCTKLPLGFHRIVEVKAIWGWFNRRRDQNDKDIVIAREKTPEFIRFLENDEDGGELQTAVVSYRKKLPWSLLRPGLQVDLVAVVHLADKLYFENLQKELADYDRVLYEMVVDKDSQEPNGNTKTHWMPPKILPGEIIDHTCIDHLMAFTLALDFQGDCIDYWRENWYHADLDSKTFEVMRLERNEEDLFEQEADMAFLNDEEEIEEALSLPEGLDPWRSKLLWASRSLPMPLVGMFFIESICAFSSSPISKSPEMRALYRLDLAAALKLFLAKELTSFSVLKVEERELVKKSVIIGERNRVAMQELRAAIDEGCKRIAIFYGSGHMPDMDERLRTEFGLVPTQSSWRTAWSIKDQRSSDLVSIQIIALLILSLILSLIFVVDLCLWKLFFSLVMKIANAVYQYFIAALHFLHKHR